MSHERVGHVRFPRPAFEPRRNPGAGAGFDWPDPKIPEMLEYIESLRFSLQLRALDSQLSPDERSLALGGYHAVLQCKERFVAMFVTPLTQPPPRVDEGAQEAVNE